MQDLKRRQPRRTPQTPYRRSAPVTIRRSNGRRLMVMPEQLRNRMAKRQASTSPSSSVNFEQLKELGVLGLLLLRLIPSLAVFGAASWLAWGSWQSIPQVFEQNLGVLSIEGTELLTQQEAVETLQLPVSQPLQQIDPYQVALLAAGHQVVHTAHVRRHFPDQLHVYLEEFTPQATIEHRGQLYLIDEQRQILMKVPVEGIVNPPVLRGFDRQEAEDLAQSFRLGQALRFRESLRHQDLFRQRVQYIDVEEPLNVKVKLLGEPTIIFFGSNFFAERVDIFQQIYGPIMDRHQLPRRIDLRYHNKLIVMP